jgi:hypothetical protein
MKGGSDGPPSLYHSHRIVVRSGDPRPGNERSGSRFGDGRVRTTDRRWDDVPKQTGAGGASRSWNGVTQRPWAARSWGRAARPRGARAGRLGSGAAGGGARGRLDECRTRVFFFLHGAGRELGDGHGTRNPSTRDGYYPIKR